MSRQVYLNFQRANAAEYAYEQANPITPQDIPKAKRISTGAIIAIIIAILIVIAIIIVVIILLRRRASSSGNGNTPNPPAPPVIEELCETSSDCQFPKVCKTSLGLCVECLDDSSCGTVFTKCRTDTNKCVKCLQNSDCTGPEICSEFKCCNQSAPIITSITTRTWNQAPRGVTALDINYTNFQGNGAIQAYLFVEDPATNTPLLSSACLDKPDKTCATAAVCPPGDICNLSKCSIPSCYSSNVRSTFLVNSSLVNLRLFRGVPCNFKIRIVYTCGGLTNQLTPYSNTFTYSPSFCSIGPMFTPNIVAVVDGDTDIDNPNPGFMMIYTDTNDSGVKIGILASQTANQHPELDEIYYQDDNTNIPNNFANQDPAYPNSRYFLIPHPSLTYLSETWHYRITSVWPSLENNGCRSSLSNQMSF